jgi:HSP20 family protein
MTAMRGLYGDLFSEINRLQQNLDQLFRPSGAASLRAMPRRTFPVINVGTTPEAIEVLALAPGVDPSAMQITVDKGVLVIAGERKSQLPDEESTAGSTATAASGQMESSLSIYTQERFDGSFRRVISLPDDIDASKVEAKYRDGLLRVRVGRQEASRPRRIEVS